MCCINQDLPELNSFPGKFLLCNALLLKMLIYFICTHLCACMHYMQCPSRSEEAANGWNWSYRELWEDRCGCRGPNWRPLREQRTFLTAEQLSSPKAWPLYLWHGNDSSPSLTVLSYWLVALALWHSVVWSSRLRGGTCYSTPSKLCYST